MKTVAWSVWIPFLAAVLAGSAAMGQASATSDRPLYSQFELDQMLAPIALYPDPLLSQVLMAATYPLDVVRAARWSRSSSGFQGDQAVRAVEDQDWDPSVKSLVAFPEVLSMMDEKLEWTQRLGDAFVSQQAEVMGTVQALRVRAYRAGNLQSSEEIVVQRQGPDIIIEPPTPELIYVPYYDPYAVYGPWWASEYPPVYWSPVRRHYYRAGYGGFRWDRGIVLGGGFFFGSCDWSHHRIQIGNDRAFYYHARAGSRDGDGWRHDSDHRHAVAYRDPAARQYPRWGDASGVRPESRRTEQIVSNSHAIPAAHPATQTGFFSPRVAAHANSATRSAVAAPTPTPQYHIDRSAPPAYGVPNQARARGSMNPNDLSQSNIPALRSAVYRSSPQGTFHRQVMESATQPHYSNPRPQVHPALAAPRQHSVGAGVHSNPARRK